MSMAPKCISEVVDVGISYHEKESVFVNDINFRKAHLE
jgi:hypothetical protein